MQATADAEVLDGAAARVSEAAPRARAAGQAAPYLKARRSWDERFGDQIQRARHWRLVAVLASAVALVLAVGLVMLARQSRLVPYVVAINELGRPVASGVARPDASLDARMMRAALADFVTSWRSVTTDWPFQRRAIEQVFAQMGQGSPAQVAVTEWYQKDPPQDRAKKTTTSVEISTVLETGDRTWEVTWKEVNRLVSGQQEGTEENYKALFTVAVNPPGTEEDARANPLGVFVTQVTWARVF